LPHVQQIAPVQRRRIGQLVRVQQNLVINAIVNPLQTGRLCDWIQLAQPIRYRHKPKVRRISIQLMATEKPPRGHLAREHSRIESRRRCRDD
jgi:hypothetical protein